MTTDEKIRQLLKQRIADLAEETAFWQAQFHAVQEQLEVAVEVLTPRQREKIGLVEDGSEAT